MLGMLVVFGVLLILFSGTTYTPSTLLVFGVLPLPVLLAFIVVIFLGVGQSLFFPLINAVLVEAAPENMRGRILGVLSLDRAMMAIGAALAGILADSIGAQVTQVLFGVGCVITAVVMFAAYPALRRID